MVEYDLVAQSVMIWMILALAPYGNTSEEYSLDSTRMQIEVALC